MTTSKYKMFRFRIVLTKTIMQFLSFENIRILCGACSVTGWPIHCRFHLIHSWVCTALKYFISGSVVFFILLFFSLSLRAETFHNCFSSSPRLHSLLPPSIPVNVLKWLKSNDRATHKYFPELNRLKTWLMDGLRETVKNLLVNFSLGNERKLVSKFSVSIRFRFDISE